MTIRTSLNNQPACGIGAIAAMLLAGSAQAAGGGAIAQAVVQSCDDTHVSGFAVLSEIPSDQGVREVDIYLQVEGLTPGAHGVHIHETASCKPCGSAGGHFDPGPVGLTSPDGNHPFHLGDLVNIKADDHGLGVLTATTTRVRLDDGPIGLYDEDGSAFIVHVNEDSFCPDGVVGGCAGGARAACAIITSSSVDESLQLAVSSSQDRHNTQPLNRNTVRGDVFVFVAPARPSTNVDNVDMFLDGEYVRTEFYAPYDLLGTFSGRGRALDTRDLADGTHTVAAVFSLASGETEYRSATFTVSNDVDIVDGD